jgi:transcriptional regulator with XRE-family HTH domain
MDAGRLVLAARKRQGLSQRELASRTGIPQPMISAIERGRQDPRHSTLERVLAACGQELDIAMRAGRGIDRTQFVETLRLSPRERLRRGVAGSRAVARFVKRARRVV